MRGTGVLAGVVVAALFAVTASASAADRYASPTGSGPQGVGGCPESNPCGLEAAIEGNSVGAVVDDDHVLLLPGTYSVPAGDIVASDAIEIGPRDPQTRPQISATSPTSALLRLADAVELHDIDISHTLATAGSSATLQAESPGAVIERVRVRVTLTDGPNHVACQLFDGLLRDSSCAIGGDVVNSLEIAVGAVIGGPAGTYTPELRNVTAWAPDALGSGVEAFAAGNNVQIALTGRNVISNAASGDLFAATSGGAGQAASITMTNSNYETVFTVGSGTATQAGTGSNQVVDPLLADPENGDFHQLAASPTIDQGAADPALGAQDPDFGARSQGGGPDIGADELPGTPVLTATSPASGANDNAPRVLGSAPAGSTVRIYATATCSGSPLATATAADLAGDGIGVNVADNSVTELRATAADPGGGGAGACSAPISYSESTPASQDPPPDTKAPAVTITAKPKATVKTTKKTAKFSVEFRADESATFTCALDGKAPTACASPFKGKAKRGRHTVSVTATDAAGNESAPATASWTVKRKRPRR